jgi:hypothetical protein
MRRGGLPGIMIAGGGIDIFYLGRRGTAVLQATYFITHRHSILGGLAFKGIAFVFEICRFLENAYFLQWKSDSSKSRCNKNIRNVINV